MLLQASAPCGNQFAILKAVIMKQAAGILPLRLVFVPLAICRGWVEKKFKKNWGPVKMSGVNGAVVLLSAHGCRGGRGIETGAFL
jgi:hypothetical protein